MTAVGHHPNSLANLKPAWNSATSPAPASSHGRAIIGWMNTMGSWPTERIQGVADDASAPTNKRLAAKSIIRSMSDDWAKNGKPHAMEDLNLGMDRTDGKPVQRVEVQRIEVRDPAGIRADLIKVLAESPGLLESLRAAGVLPGAVGEGSGAEGGAPNRVEDGG